jgi:hypothetical protein
VVEEAVLGGLQTVGGLLRHHLLPVHHPIMEVMLLNLRHLLRQLFRRRA